MTDAFVLNLGSGWEWSDIEKTTGYKPLTTYYEMFSKAEKGGQEEIKKLFDDLFSLNKQASYQYLTEFSLVLNWKMWYFYEHDNQETSHYYESLWRKVDKYALDHLKGEGLSYYLRTTD